MSDPETAPSEVVVTPEMIEAGVNFCCDREIEGIGDLQAFVWHLFQSMLFASVPDLDRPAQFQIRERKLQLVAT